MTERTISREAGYVAARLKGVLQSPKLILERKGVDPIVFDNPLEMTGAGERVHTHVAPAE